MSLAMISKFKKKSLNFKQKQSRNRFINTSIFHQQQHKQLSGIEMSSESLSQGLSTKSNPRLQTKDMVDMLKLRTKDMDIMK